MKAYSFKIKLLLILSLLGLSQISHAQNKDKVSLEQASETIRKQTNGKVLSATTKNLNGVKSHRIQVLTKSGRVKVYQVPVNKNQSSRKNEGRSQPNYNSNNSYNYRNPTQNYRPTNSNAKPSDRNQSTRQSSRPQVNSNSSNRSNNTRSNASNYKTQPRSQSRSVKKPSRSNGDKTDK